MAESRLLIANKPIKEGLTMRRRSFGTLVSLICIALLGLLPSISFAEKGKWTKKEDMPTARADLATSVVNGKIYAIGGEIRGGYTTATEEYDPAKGTWTRKANMPTLRGYLSSAAVNGKIYVIGGQGFGPTWQTVEEYDSATDRWTKRADMPTARSWLTTVALGGKIFAIGGYAGDPPQNIRTYLPTVEVYDPETNTWMKRPDMPTARCLLSASAVKGKIYAIGGFTWPGGGWMFHSAMEEYDTGLPEGVEAKGKLATSWGKMKNR